MDFNDYRLSDSINTKKSTFVSVFNKNDLAPTSIEFIRFEEKKERYIWAHPDEIEQIDDDLVTITPQLKNNKGDVIKEFKPIKIKSYGGIKVDFSSGYLLSFLGNQNFTNLYDSSGIVGVQKNKTDNLTHAIGVLFNVYPRSRHDINPGFSFGVSIPTDGISVGFYGGASLLMLEKNRLILSAGMAYNKIKILNTGNLLKNDELTKISGKETYKFSNSDFKEINYDDIYKSSFFIGLTYNIFTLKK